MEEDDKSIFTRLKGSYKYYNRTKKYYFYLNNGNKFICEKIISLADPTYDTSFKLLFGCNGSEGRLKDILSSFLFPNQEEAIIITKIFIK